MTDEWDELPEQMRVRREKLDRIRERAAEPYPVSVPRTVSIGALRDNYGDLAADSATGDRVSVAGRIVLKRDSGKLCFATLRVLAGRWVGLAAEDGARVALDTATVSRLGWEREQPVIRTWNVTP